MKIQNIRKLHSLLTIIFILPIIIIFSSGMVLITKSFFPVIQSPVIEAKTLQSHPLLQLEQFKNEPNIEQIIYRPDKNNISIRYKDYMEKQIHAQSGEVLSYSKRHTNWIIKLHQGSYFSDFIKEYIFIPTALVLQLIWISGLAIYIFTKLKRRKI